MHKKYNISEGWYIYIYMNCYYIFTYARVYIYNTIKYYMHVFIDEM